MSNVDFRTADVKKLLSNQEITFSQGLQQILKSKVFGSRLSWYFEILACTFQSALTLNSYIPFQLSKVFLAETRNIFSQIDSKS